MGEKVGGEAMREFDYLKLKDRLWDSEILSYVAQIHEYKGRQELYIRQKPVELERLVEISKIQSTESSNKIEGIITTSARIRQLCEDKTTPRNRDEREIMGYRDVLNTIHESYEYIPIRSSYILQLHRDLYRYSERTFGGRYKNTQNYISENRTDGTQIIRFTPVPPYETPSAVNAICDSYQRALDMQVVDPLILIPIFINDFLCIHPFNDGNGRMSRLLTTLLLYRSGYVVGKYISLERKIERTKNIYYDVLEETSRGWHEEQNDPTAFIKYLLSIVLNCYRDFEERIDTIGPKSTAYDIVKKAVSEKLGKFTKKDILELCPSLGSSSVEAALKKLKDEDYIRRNGNGRSTFYVRNPDAESFTPETRQHGGNKG